MNEPTFAETNVVGEDGKPAKRPPSRLRLLIAPGWFLLGVSLFDRPFVFTPRSIITERNERIEGAAVFGWLPDGGYDMPRSEVFGLNARG